MSRLDSDNGLKIICLGFIVIFFLFIFFMVMAPIGKAYYSFAGLGLYGGGLGGGAGLTSFYGLGGLFGLGGIYGLNSLYGLGGLFGLNNLYALGGLYGLGSYGLSNQYGLGLYTMGMLNSLCNLSGPYGLGGFYGLGGLCGISGMPLGLGGILGTGMPLGSIGLLSNPGAIMPGSSPGSNQVTATISAEQAGTWSGTWTSTLTLKTGPMTMSLVEDPLTGLISGEVNLILNKVTNSLPADVSGYITTSIGPGSLGITGTGGTAIVFLLSGGNLNLFSSTILFLPLLPSIPSIVSIYTINLVCVMTTPVSMAGTFEVQDINKLLIDSGDFSLTLIAPVI